MVIGVIMVNVVPGQEKAAYNQLLNVNGIKEIYHVLSAK
jgi:hypothetical protein